ncbi:hypothetical protein V5799_024762 [Amblyomma americanum]|uniref:Uncharacterized protein n=1 Tax=Amblyomma americanum TaxID=6943 RepID=A0AAQ4EB91_AMBAM
MCLVRGSNAQNEQRARCPPGSSSGSDAASRGRRTEGDGPLALIGAFCLAAIKRCDNSAGFHEPALASQQTDFGSCGLSHCVSGCLHHPTK